MLSLRREKKLKIGINGESSGAKEKNEALGKIFQNPKKSDYGVSKAGKDSNPIKSGAFYLNISKRGHSKSKGATDSLWKEQISLAMPKKAFGTADFRDRSKDTAKSKDFGKLLKKVTSTL